MTLLLLVVYGVLCICAYEVVGEIIAAATVSKVAALVALSVPLMLTSGMIQSIARCV